MGRRLVHFRHVVRRLAGLAFVASVALTAGTLARAGVAEGKEGLMELGKSDARLKGHYAPKGFNVRVVAAEPTLVNPAAMAFDDHGNLFVAEWKPADRTFETSDTLASPETGPTRVRRGRKSSLDVIRRLKDADGDGVFESSEVVLDGCEMPTCILPYKNSLLLACVGRLERWSDEDGDGYFETRVVLVDGFAAMDRRGLSGMALGADGWLYLTTGDDDNHVAGPDGSRADLYRTGGVFRSKLDGSRITAFAMGLRNPYKGLAFDANYDLFLLDGDLEDGSKFQGVRLVNPVEEGDYGWRLRPGSSGGHADFDRAAVGGERPGKLPVVARLGRGSPQGLVIYNGLALPQGIRDTLIQPDAARKIIRGFKVEPKGGSHVLKGETTLMTAEDDQFRPCQVVVGADGALYVLDRRGHAPGDASAGSESKAGRLYRITWEGDGVSPALKTRPNHWQRLFNATNDELVFQYMASFDHAEADRALRELLDRGPSALAPCMAWATNTSATLYARLLGIQGIRQLWSDQVEAVLISLLGDPSPEVRRLAAQSLAWEPKAALPRLVPKLLPHLDDADGRVVRDVALAIGRHAEPRPRQTSAALLRWLYAHPQADAAVKDAFVRSLERLGDVGVEEVALAIRTRRGVEREAAVALYSAFRTAPAVERLDGLVMIPDLAPPEQLALVRQFQDFPPNIPVPTQGLAEWVGKHLDVDPSVKIAVLNACRLAGNPASALVLPMLEDEDEGVRQAATQAAAQFRPPGTLDRLVDRLKAKDASASERLGAVKALRFAGPKAFAALDSAYLDADDAEFRKAALRSLADADRVKANPALESALFGPDPILRATAARILGESPKTAPMLGKAFLNRTLRRDELPIVLASLRKHDGPENRTLLATVEDEATSGSAAITPSEIRSRLAEGGDPWAGLGVFFRESSKCSTCHRVEGRGGVIGPPLTMTGPGPGIDRLIESILSPSREVKDRYETSRVVLKEGRTFQGILASRDARSLTLLERDGREVRIAPGLIESESREATSLMPAHVSLDLTPSEIVDLVAFLQSRPARDSLKHGPRRLDRVFAVGPFAPGADRLRIPLDRVETSRTLVGQDGTPATWISQESSGWGTLNLRGQLGARPGRVYLAVQVQSAREQAAALRFGVEGAARVYLNGSRVSDVPERDAQGLTQAFARPPSNCLAPLPDLARLALKPGWNLLIIAIDRSESGPGDLRAAFEIVCPEPIEIRTPRN